MQEEKELRSLGWCILELMGHRRLAGQVSEESLFGTVLLRIDVPGEEGAIATQYYGGGSIYCITPTTEELARQVAKRCGRQLPPRYGRRPGVRSSASGGSYGTSPGIEVDF